MVFKNNKKKKGVKRIAAGVSSRGKRQKRETGFAHLYVSGSMTLEAALTIPIFTFAVTVLITVITIAGLQMRVRQAVYEGVRSASSAPYTMGRGASGINAAVIKGASLASVKGYFMNGMREHETACRLIEGGSGGVVLTSDIINNEAARIHITASYKAKVPLAIFGSGISVKQDIEGYAWLGDEFMNSSSNEKMVYITPHGTVYHEDINCTYLKPRVSSIAYTEVSSKRNSGGEKYRECEACTLKSGIRTPVVYITSYGNRYHTNPNCVKIKHEVITVPLSQVGNRHKCLKEEGRGLIRAGGS